MASLLLLKGHDPVASTSTGSASQHSIAAKKSHPDPVKIIFSDLDGTLIHYPKTTAEPESGDVSPKPTTGSSTSASSPSQKQVLEFPPSSTGLVGEISTRTMSLVDEIRHEHGVKFVLISGMRTSTLLQRLPYLPRADAYCSENGGRIFYPLDEDEHAEDDDDDDVFWVNPKRYKHDGKTKTKPHRSGRFGIREDKAWRARMVSSLGGDSFGHFALQDIYDAQKNPASTSVPLHERDGFLWDFARDLIHSHGFVVDIKGYSTCFRVNKKQQTSETAAATPPSEILALLDDPQWTNYQRDAIDCSVNLSCIDFYPSRSGKKNCCLYLASKFFPTECLSREEKMDGDSDLVTSPAEADEDDVEDGDDDKIDAAKFLSNHAICLCDDDNDLEMALTCGHAYLPGVSSESMQETVDRFPDHFTTTFFRGTVANSDGDWSSPESEGTVVEGTDSSDRALSMIWNRTSKEAPALPKKRSLVQHKLFRVALILSAVLVLKEGNRSSPKSEATIVEGRDIGLLKRFLRTTGR